MIYVCLNCFVQLYRFIRGVMGVCFMSYFVLGKIYRIDNRLVTYILHNPAIVYRSI